MILLYLLSRLLHLSLTIFKVIVEAFIIFLFFIRFSKSFTFIAWIFAWSIILSWLLFRLYGPFFFISLICVFVDLLISSVLQLNFYKVTKREGLTQLGRIRFHKKPILPFREVYLILVLLFVVLDLFSEYCDLPNAPSYAISVQIL